MFSGEGQIMEEFDKTVISIIAKDANIIQEDTFPSKEEILVSNMEAAAKMMQDADFPSDFGQLITPIGDEKDEGEEVPIRKVRPIPYPPGFKSLLVVGKKVLLEGEILEVYQTKRGGKHDGAPRYWFKGIGILEVKEKWQI
jgi:hypothetical protein